MEHTKGPWNVAETRHGYDCIIRNVDNDPVAITQIAGYSPKTGEANARLIAAAPELLEALKPLAEQDCDSWGCEYTVGYETKRFPDHNCPPMRARAALAKAEGKSPA